MSYTNKTTHYELPQYVATDKPKYLTDFNETMAAIDTQMYTNAQAAATADSKAVSAQSTADGAVSSIGTLNTQINGDPTDPSDTGLAGEVSGIDTDLNTVQSLIGNGHPTSSDQTIIGAINGLEAAVAPREDGDNLANSYSTGDQFARGGSVYEALVSLTAGTAFSSLVLNTDYKVAKTLVEQIKEAGEGGTAAGTSYDNSGSGLTADDVQEAIDEVNAKIGAYQIIGLDETVVVTADGVKTVSELLDEMHAALHAMFSALPDGVTAEMLCLRSTAIGGTSVAIPQFYKNFDNASDNEVLIFGSRNITSGHILENCVRIVTSGSESLNGTYENGQPVALTDHGSDVPTNGKTITIHYRKIKNI